MLSIIIGRGFVVANISFSFSLSFAVKRLPKHIIYLLQFALQSLLDLRGTMHASNQLVVKQHLLASACLLVLQSGHIFKELFLNLRAIVFRENCLLSIFREHKIKLKF